MKKLLVFAGCAMCGAAQAVILTPNVMTNLPANTILPLGIPIASNSQTLNLIGYYDNLTYATVTISSTVMQLPSSDLLFQYTITNHSTSTVGVGGANIVPTGAFVKDAYSGYSTGQDAVAAYDNLYGVQVRYGLSVYGDPCIVPGTTGASFFFITNAPSYTLGTAQVFGNDLFTQSFNYASVYVPVPEPAPVFALSLGALLVVRRKKS